MLYLDTSVLVAALVPEAQTKRVHDWLLSHRSHELVISDWVLTEFASALAIKCRTGQLSPAENSQADTLSEYDWIRQQMNGRWRVELTAVG